MKIQIITEREIKADEYWLWARSSLESINLSSRLETGKNRLCLEDFEKLLSEGQLSYEDSLGYTKAKTTFKIIKR